MAITDKKGINVTSGFKLVSANPIDARFIAVDETDLQSLIDNGAVYNGLEVWVDSLGKKLIYNGTEFVEISAGSEVNVKVFEDVEELPAEPNDNTIYRLNVQRPVPNSGYVDKVYLNTSLNDDEITALCDNLTFNTEIPAEFVLLSSDLTINLWILNLSMAELGLGYAISNEDMSEVYYISNKNSLELAAALGVTFVGWNPNFNGEIEIKNEVISYLEGLPVGFQNDKIVSLVNIGSGLKYINVKDGVAFEFAEEQPDDTYYIDIFYTKDVSGDNFKAELDKIQLPLDLKEDLIKNGKIIIRVKELVVNLLTGTMAYKYSYYRVTTGYILPMGGTDADGKPYVFISLSFGNVDRSHGEYVVETYTINLNTIYTAEDGLIIENSFYQKLVDSSSTSSTTNTFVDIAEEPKNPDTNVIYRKVNEPVPIPHNDGEFVKRFYINYTLTPQEVDNILDTANLNYIDGAAFDLENFNVYGILLFNSSNSILGLLKLGSDPYACLGIAKGKEGTPYAGIYSISIFGATTGKVFDIYNSLEGFVHFKDKVGDEIFNINSNCISSLQGIPMGLQNNNLVNLFNTNGIFNQQVEYTNYFENEKNVINSPVKKIKFTDSIKFLKWLYVHHKNVIKIRFVAPDNETTYHTVQMCFDAAILSEPVLALNYNYTSSEASAYHTLEIYDESYISDKQDNVYVKRQLINSSEDGSLGSSTTVKFTKERIEEYKAYPDIFSFTVYYIEL